MGWLQEGGSHVLTGGIPPQVLYNQRSVERWAADSMAWSAAPMRATNCRSIRRDMPASSVVDSPPRNILFSACGLKCSCFTIRAVLTVLTLPLT